MFIFVDVMILDKYKISTSLAIYSTVLKTNYIQIS